MVIKASPFLKFSEAIFFKNFGTASAIVFTCPGVPVTACASILPLLLKIPAEISPASLTRAPKATLSKTFACSSHIEIS